MKLLCKKSVKKKDGTKAFTKGMEYRARRGSVMGLDDDLYKPTPVFRAKNDQGESHIVKLLNKELLDGFFEMHFDIL